MELALVFLLGLGLAMYLVIKVVARVTKGMGRIATGGLYKGGRSSGGATSRLVWLMLRAFGALLGVILWAASVVVRPFLAALVLILLWRAWRRYQKFLGGAETVGDALLFGEIRNQLNRTWETFPTTIFTDANGGIRLPVVEGWKWVYTISGRRFGIQASIRAAEGSSLGAIDDLTAPPGDKEERLASTLNAHLDTSRSLASIALGDKLPRFAAIDVQTTLERLQTLTYGEVPEVRSGEGVITLMNTDPLWETVPMPMPLFDKAWDTVKLPLTVYLGVDRWGQPVAPKLTRTRIMARSGWGKSVLLDTLLANLVYYPPKKVIIILIDCKWGMHHLKWGPCVDLLVTHPDRATEACKAVYDQMEARATLLKSQGLEELPEATEELPLIVVIADEAQKLPWSKGRGPMLAMDYFIKFYQEGRALGIYPVMTLQYGTAATFPREIAMNVELDIAGKLRDRSGSSVAMGDDVVDKSFGPHCIVDTPLNKGVFAIKTEMGLGTYMKCFNTTPAAKLALVDHYSQYQRPHYSWLPSYQDQAFYEEEEVEEVEVDDESWAAITELATALCIEPEDVSLDALPELLGKAKGRMPKARHTAVSQKLASLIAA